MTGVQTCALPIYDDFEFIGNQTDTYIMIGNAVPPTLAKCVALAVAEVLDRLEGNRD